MPRKRILDRYLKIKQKEGLMPALKQLEKDKDLLPKSTYYWVRKKLTEGGPIIYVINDETVLEVCSEKIAEAIDAAFVTTARAILDHLREMNEKGVNIKMYIEEHSWLYELMT